MTRMNSRPVQITQVYPQDTAPTDTRDGILWVDTSVSPPKTKTWDSASAQWAPVATSAVDVQNTAPDAPDNGDIWVDTSLSRPRAKVYDTNAGQWNKQVDATELGNHKANATAHHSPPTTTQTASVGGGYEVVANAGNNNGPASVPEPQNRQYSDAIYLTANVTSTNVQYNVTVELTFKDGSTETYSFTTPLQDSSYTVHRNYSERRLTQVEVLSYEQGGTEYDGYDVDFEPHYLAVASHSHSI